MNFVDKVNITTVAGKGGDGHRSFRREKFIAMGGPDGGDGGNGGDVVFKASRNLNTLAAFRYSRLVSAKDGQPGGNAKRHGKNGLDLIVNLPVGTEVKDTKGEVIADLVSDGQEHIIAKGGKGGFGNAHFTSSTRQAPNFAEKGEPGEKHELILELKLLADIGLVGLPNAGKSTLLSKLSNARPEIADYPFTTLVPNLGVVDIDQDFSALMADIPGLIEGAALGKGLGHEFLRHIERTKLIVHLIDVYNEDTAKSYKVIRSELKAHGAHLENLPEIVVLTKIDGIDPKLLKPKQAELKRILKPGTPQLSISALAGKGLDNLKYSLKEQLLSLRAKPKAKAKRTIPRITLAPDPRDFNITKTPDGFIISGVEVERFAARTDFNNLESEVRYRTILKKLGVLHELKRLGVEADDEIFLGENKQFSFRY